MCASKNKEYIFKFIGFVREKIINRVIDSYNGYYKDLKTGKLLTKIIDSPYIFYHMAKETKNVNAAVRAEELRGKVAGLYIDRQILAATKMVRLPDGTMKLEQVMTEQDYENLMMNIQIHQVKINLI